MATPRKPGSNSSFGSNAPRSGGDRKPRQGTAPAGGGRGHGYAGDRAPRPAEGNARGEGRRGDTRQEGNRAPAGYGDERAPRRPAAGGPRTGEGRFNQGGQGRTDRAGAPPRGRAPEGGFGDERRPRTDRTAAEGQRGGNRYQQDDQPRGRGRGGYGEQASGNTRTGGHRGPRDEQAGGGRGRGEQGYAPRDQGRSGDSFYGDSRRNEQAAGGERRGNRFEQEEGVRGQGRGRYNDQASNLGRPGGSPARGNQAGGRGRDDSPGQRDGYGHRGAGAGDQPRRGAQGGYGGQSADGRRRPPEAPQHPPVERAKKLRVRRGSEKHEMLVQQLREKRVDERFVGDLRIQKALALSGVGSRRDCDEWVSQGRVSINGKTAEPGARVAMGDMVRIDGRPIDIKWPDRLPRIVLYHKQEGELVSRDDPEGRTTVFDRLPKVQSSAWVAVGRLDYNTSGLLIFTTSGDLANRLMHPRFEVEREYAVRLLGSLTDEQMKELRSGITLDDGEARFEVLEDQGGEGKNHWYRVILREGRNREVRRMFEHFELQVSRLMRVRFGSLTLPSRLKRGQYYELEEPEVLAVLKWAGLGLTGRESTRRPPKREA